MRTMFNFLPGSPAKKWVLAAAMIVAPLGCAIGLGGRAQGYDGANRLALALMLLSLVSLITGAWIRPLRLHGEVDRPLDEREEAFSTGVYAKGWALPAAFGALICTYMGAAISEGWWFPSHEQDWSLLSQTMFIWLAGMPITVANWRTPAPLPEEDDQ